MVSHCTVYVQYSTLQYSIYYGATLHSVCIVQYSTVHYTLYTVHYTLYTIHWVSQAVKCRLLFITHLDWLRERDRLV